MGEVYLASDSRLGRKVALKILPDSYRDDPERLRRFQHEARAASSLNHPNVATIYEIAEAGDRSFIAMEYIEGITLEQTIGSGPLPVAELIGIATQVVDAVSEAHGRGIIHRDLKPGNIMLTARQQAKVLDFGLAKMTVESTSIEQMNELPTAVKTAPGLVMGTVDYMSPEQALGHTIDERSDIWSLGVVLYEMATGRKPFSGATSTEIIDKLRHEQPEAIARFNYNVPADLERIVRKCLEKDRECRYQSGKELLIDLKNLKRDVESSPDRTTSIRTQRAPTSTNKRIIVAAVTFAVIAIVAAYYLLSRRQTAGSPSAENSQIKSIAVLPFKPLVADKRDETLEMGMADTLITKLSNIRRLDLRPISAVRKYSGLEQDAIAAGREQKVDAVLDGVIQRVDDKVRVSVRFVRVADGLQLWSGQFQENITEIFAVQDSISERVASALALTLAGGERAQLTKHHTRNTEAYELFLKGRFHLKGLTDEGFLKGRDYLQQAVDLDPDYALAHAALANAYVQLGGFNVLSPKEAFPKGRESAVRALQLDQNLAEPHTSLGMVSFAYDWDWKNAETEFNRAIELNPNDPESHQMYSYYLMAMKRLEESLREMNRSLELDPASISRISGVGEILNLMGRSEEAIAQYGKALEMDPNSGFVHWALGNVYLHRGQYDKAISQYQKSIPLSGTSPDEPLTLAYTYAKTGRRKQALEIVEELKSRRARSYVPPTLVATVYAALQDHDQAIYWLNKAVEERDGVLTFTKVDPMFAGLHSDPRSATVLSRLNLP